MFILAIVEENVSQAMEVARATGRAHFFGGAYHRHIDVMSLSYNRMMNHIRYMAARAVSGGKT